MTGFDCRIDPNTGIQSLHGPVAPACPWCGHVGEPVEVAGHTQCTECHQVVESCCGG